MDPEQLRTWIQNSSGLNSIMLLLSSHPDPWSAWHNRVSGLPLPHAVSWLVVESEVKPGEIQQPSHLVAVKLLSNTEILKVLVIGPNLYGVSHTL